MPSSEKIVSPGVFTNEIDQTFLPAAIGEIGGALIGPTVKGPALVPTVVNSYSEFQQRFGDTFKSGSTPYQYLTSHTAREYLKHSGRLTVVRILAGTFGGATAYVPTGSVQTPGSGVESPSFKLHTLSDGALQNTTTSSVGLPNAFLTNAVLQSGSKHNLRWEVSQKNQNKGTFTLLIRRGDDSDKRKQILESWTNISLDQNQNNYIAKIIGDQKFNMRTDSDGNPYMQLSGSFANKSKYVRVEVLKPLIDYLDENGNIRINSDGQGNPGTGSLPGLSSGSFVGGSDGYIGFDALGNQIGPGIAANFYENITSANSQGYVLNASNSGSTSYLNALNLLKNQDEYDINLIMIPGVISGETNHSTVAQKAIDVCETRGDCFVVLDPVVYGSTISAATSEAENRDSSYAAHYWPWIQIPDPELGKVHWVPPSVVIPSIYAFNDKVAHPWFAPAGLNRGGIDVAIQAERKLTHSDRDTLYDSAVNPIATFPGQGVTVWGQKTLQKKASALDRVNVRRLLIKLKKFIASSSRFLVFEQNNSATRARFLNIVNPYLEQVQSNSGLTSFRVVMDESNNTPDLVDRNILYGQIFIQPTRTAEFIVLDFTVQPTGATFPE